MKKIRIGIIGAGRIGKVHARSITYHIPTAEVAAISDINLKMAAEVANEFGIPACYADYEAILQDPSIDAVLICAPTGLHSQIAIPAARAGKHIFCEKPVEMTLEKIMAIKKAVEDTGIKLQVGFNRRFDHNFQRVQELAASGALGKIQVIKITSRDPQPPSAQYVATSGGMFLDMTIHDFDMARFLSGSEVVEVFAKAAVLVDPAIGQAGDVDTAVITLTFASGALGVIDNCRQAVYGYDQRVEVFGSKGMASAENDTPTSVKVSTQDAISSDKPLYFFLERYMASYTSEIQQFVTAILEDKPVSVNIDDGLLPVAIAIAARKSMLENRPVRIDEVFTS